MFKKKHATPAVTLKETWKDGDTATKLTFFIMGLNAIKHRQWLKGFSLLFSEIVFLIWFFLSGIHSIAGFNLIPKFSFCRTAAMVNTGNMASCFFHNF